MKRFENKVALVTGAQRGIGYDIARAFAAEGADVVMTDVSAEGVKAAAAAIAGETGARTLALAADVTDYKDCERSLEETFKAFGKLDVLVNNAGVARDNLVLRMKEEDFQAVLDVNLKGAFLMAKAASRSMLRLRSGRIINIASVVGQSGNAGQANYAASKAGLIGLTKSLAREFASRQVLVNAVAPGYIRTAMTDGFPEEAKARLLEMVPLGRLGSGDDVAKAVLFLAGEDSPYITGQVLAVNGGIYM
ncbi:MAG: 3-oxoacyl-[acyl-carrier-protein] reductase [Elusimicrobia bacterium GWA2_56_46]|nr:MAG: 3-oxoacyl-[acyl-carrier-protein] reductase [Elusimicrobia bacterium GWA2_56_46]OGR55686.1 MAG: 3-oxoacyl-[acyl-carrier-protein] reductase [Elusimicrobia bacterium GWC2_56_31]HBB66522.1 3-oxoacyl-[acyl-carrier-protein] reductase [Elusimicrobiota bacterium]HBW23562.1 3-oxoacyl-[acyl-carrier-protein] reductase [Elusimicrobiota bacterium]